MLRERVDSIVKIENAICVLKFNFQEKTISVVPVKGAPDIHNLIYVLYRNKKFKKLCRMVSSYKRKNLYKVIKRTGRSGAKDYYLKVAEPIRMGSVWTKYYKIKTMAHIHVSMYGKLNEGLDIFIADLLEILESDSNYFKANKCKYKYLKGITMEDLLNAGFIDPLTLW